jgi:A/G-specific adenine glycosylase
MLQQTQVSRVLPKYKEFLAAFPTVRALAKASPARVLRVWKGMGYNRRALYLQRTARSIVYDYQGKFPKSEDKLVQLPGLGTYTARALLVFAHRKDIAMIDTNIRQIITHFFFEGKKQKERIIQETADTLVPKGKSWEWHQALMDYGALALVRERKRPIKGKKQEPVRFKDSDRFYRGRIVDRLRVGSVREEVLLKEFQDTYGKKQEPLAKIVEGLLGDGLIARSIKGVLHLPEM